MLIREIRGKLKLTATATWRAATRARRLQFKKRLFRLHFGNTTRITCQASRLFVEQNEVYAVEIQAVFSDGIALVFDFNFPIFDTQRLFGKGDDVQQFCGFQTVLQVVGVPQLEIDDLFIPQRAAAVDEVLGNHADLRDVKTFGYKTTVWQFKIDRHSGFQSVFYF